MFRLPAPALFGILAIAIAGAAPTAKAANDAVSLPFDPASGHVRLAATVNGKPVMVLIDTGLNPSGISLKMARAAGLPIDQSSRSPVAGYGDQQVFAYNTKIVGLEIGGRRFAPLDALSDDSALYTATDPGRRFDAILGYNFLKDGVFLVDYVKGRFTIAGDGGDIDTAVRGCRTKVSYTLPSGGHGTIPRIPNLQIGPVTGAGYLDTGQAIAIVLFQDALRPQVTAQLKAVAAQSARGAAGTLTVEKTSLPFAVGFGPFKQAGQTAAIMRRPGLPPGSLGNIGNAFMTSLKLKLLLDYKTKQMTFFGNCRG